MLLAVKKSGIVNKHCFLQLFHLLNFHLSLIPKICTRIIWREPVSAGEKVRTTREVDISRCNNLRMFCLFEVTVAVIAQRNIPSGCFMPSVDCGTEFILLVPFQTVCFQEAERRRIDITRLSGELVHGFGTESARFSCQAEVNERCCCSC